MTTYIHCKNKSSIINKIFKNNELNKDKFIPSIWYSNPLLQTIRALSLYSPKKIINNIKRDIIYLDNGGTVGVDWLITNNLSKNSPIVINFPGACADKLNETGGITGLLRNIILSKMDSIRFGNAVYQGIGLNQTSPHINSTCYCGTNDIGSILQYVRKRYPKQPLIIIASSIGAGYFTKWIGKNPTLCKKLNITGGIMIGHGTSAELTHKYTMEYCFGIVSYSVVNRWKNNIFNNTYNKEYLKSIEKTGICPGFKLSNLKKATTVKQWEIACLPLYNYKSLEEMYQNCDATHYLTNITIPLCFINSEDDPVCCYSVLKNHPIFNYPNTGFIVTPKGGHLGWIDKDNGKWFSQVIVKLINGFINET